MFPTHVGMNRWPGMGSVCAGMFPTHVGMNRLRGAAGQATYHVPHTRGDEPDPEAVIGRRCGMFPTHVGMNRHA